MPKALAAAQRAIQLDPQNGEAYTELGSIQTIYEWDWAAARGMPSLTCDARFSSIRYSFLVNRRLGVTLYLAQDYEAALAQIQRAAEMEPQPGSIDNYARPCGPPIMIKTHPLKYS